MFCMYAHFTHSREVNLSQFTHTCTQKHAQLFVLSSVKHSQTLTCRRTGTGALMQAQMHRWSFESLCNCIFELKLAA